MKVTNYEDETIVELTADDVDSAVRAFICQNVPHLATGWIINSNALAARAYAIQQDNAGTSKE